MEIREAVLEDFERIWPIFHEVVGAGETYAFSRDTNKDQALKIWIETPRKTFVFEEDGEILGTYYIKSNFAGPGEHVCNCGYMVSENARGKGIASQMCEHSQEEAARLGFRAMQFNLVVKTNEASVYLWKKLGFEVVGCLTGAFNHAKLGYVDAYIMYKVLIDQ